MAGIPFSTPETPRTLREILRSGSTAVLRLVHTRYGVEYVVIAGTPKERTRQMADMDIVFLDREDAYHWAMRESVILIDEEQ